ncbi:P-loop NTPase family protein [Paraliomyxa miuraensis]|uniref:hypothetical protein n=1 Tax=Paraliomyxa miuraensis TaxID=376150 RepID=UPI002258935D|nr:hypothetical protein [Paraliomyxa miuraensis]MCX4245226.1 hypothetical protein [Paraliomyxa miuraensis]
MSTVRERLVQRARAPARGRTPRRIAVAGATGAGKSTLARRLGRLHGLPYIDMDGLYYDRGWTPRPDFMLEASARLQAERWITDWYYESIAPVLVERAELVIWLDYPLAVTLTSTLLRSLLRRLHHEVLWAGNREGGVLSSLWNEDHALRYAVRGRARVLASLSVLLDAPGVELWRFCTPAALSTWLVAELETPEDEEERRA